ncbi:MAG: LutB/LldF family L-lactate oxidation iron-sulfur protein [Candidatus Dormibacteraeota bacterium]|nr:LutB/LldF family L-lactate oxidation iron-sulfur protein [Candidatus Dormibacteraeota bacterium]
MADAPAFTARAHVALRDIRLRAAVRNVTGQMVEGREHAFTDLADPQGVRNVARAIRYRSVERLPDLLERWATNLEARGGKVHWATDADEAVGAVRAILRRRGARFVVKGKSMASEEIHLNEALEQDGVEVLESDLGEFIIQLAHESPAHIIVPAIQKDRQDVSSLFTEDAGRPIPPDIPAEAAYARERLRSAFLTADVGVSGVNFAVADTGSICLVTNEGNGRMVTSVPPVHIAIMGMERIVASWAELDVMLALLARSATGQRLTSYTNLITGTRQADELDGPEELHVIVLDAGRTRILGSEFREVLDCIRCGACLNVCPVYRNVGGHSYGSVYPGPIGAVLTPLLHPEDSESRELANASSLCGACVEVCPVGIPLVDMLLGLRRRDSSDIGTVKRAGFSAWSAAWGSTLGYASTRIAAKAVLPVVRRARGGPGWAGAWFRTRTLPAATPKGNTMRKDR